MGNSADSIFNLVNSVANHGIVLPVMQRRYVWKSTQVRDLFDSLYRGYPVGSILVWERPSREEGRNLDVGEDAGERCTGKEKLLLDGQQRLTSLTAILKDTELIVRGRRSSIDILFNVLHPDVDEEDERLDAETESDDDEDSSEEEAGTLNLDLAKKTFVVATRRLMNQPGWVSLRRVFKEDQVRVWMSVVETLGLDLKSDDASMISDRITRIKDIGKVMIPIVILPSTMDYRTVTDVFCRVNSAGSRLKGSDLALAMITSRWHDSLQAFEDFQKKHETKGIPLFDLGFLVRAFVVFLTGQCKFATLATTPVDRYGKAWEETKNAIETAIDVARNWGLTSFTLLSAPSLIITLAYYMRKRPHEMKDLSGLHKWLLVASICGHYSKGSSESIMDQDLAAIAREVSLADMFLSFKAQGWTGRVTESEIKGKFHGSAYFGLMYLAMHEAGAKDWHKDTAISLGNVGSMLKVQFHHIFPQALLKSTNAYDKTEINDISNLAFIGGNTNRRIAAESPERYLPEIDEKRRHEQCVPTDESLYRVDRFRDFLCERRKLLVKYLNDYLEGISSLS